MKYLGGKERVSKYIIPKMLKKRNNRPWVEPFVGGASIISKVTGERYGNDVHPYLIALLKAIQNGWVPPSSVDEDLYRDVKNNKNNYIPEYVGFIGFCCSYSGIWFGSYARSYLPEQNFAAIGKRSLIKIKDKIKDICFTCGDYRDMIISNNSLIYCDPPYANSASYLGTENFNHIEFWDWCRYMSIKGHKLYISEFNAPDDFKCILSIRRRIMEGKIREDKLFVIRN